MINSDKDYGYQYNAVAQPVAAKNQSVGDVKIMLDPSAPELL